MIAYSCMIDKFPHIKLFQRAIYQAGYHVITISSPTFTNFMVNASKTAIPDLNWNHFYLRIQLVLIT